MVESGILRFSKSFVVSFGLLGGAILALWRDEVAPPSHLTRPLMAAVALALVVSAICWPAGREGPGMAAVLTLPIVGRDLVLAAAVLGLVVLSMRIWWRKVDGSNAIAAIAFVFLAAGVGTALPHLEFKGRSQVEDRVGAPVFLILLDAYPRADTLASIGIDVSWFIQHMGQRGFDHYPDAYSPYASTHRVLTAMLSGVETADDEVSLRDRRTLRGHWVLPSGFVTVAPPVGHVAVPHALDVGAEGITDLEMKLVTRSAFAKVPGIGDWLMGRWRTHIEADLASVATSGHSRVFAHLMVPHVPFIRGLDGDVLGPDPCWPRCGFMHRQPSDHPGLVGTVDWLNHQLVQLVDDLVTRWPDARIVLFSDHGGRFPDFEAAEHHAVLLLARTPDRAGMFGDDPNVTRIFEAALVHSN